MAVAGEHLRGRTSSDFFENTILEAIVPAASQVNVQEMLEAWDGELLEDKNTIVPFIEQRSFLLLDEEVPVHIVLRTRMVDEDTLKAYLARLDISIEARAYGTLYVRPDDDQKPLPANEVLYSGTVSHSQEPTICATEVVLEEEEKPSQFVYIFWKTIVPLPRPKAKINKLCIYFTPFASLKPPVEAASSEGQDDEYLPSGRPLPANLLAPFSNDLALKGAKPYLSALAVKAAPQPAAIVQHQRPLRSGSRRLFRAAPAFLWRIRFTPFPAATERDKTLAALDLEISPFANSRATLEQVTVKLTNGEVDEIGSFLPLECSPGDQITLLYKLSPDKGDTGDAQPPSLTITILGSVAVSETCVANINFTWNTPVQLPTSRPGSRAGTSDEPAKILGPDSLPQAEPPSRNESASIRNGLVFSITAPDEVYVGKTFRWELFAVNRSDKVQRLAVVALPKRRNWSQHRQRASSISIPPTSRDLSHSGLAEAVIDERALYAMQRESMQEATEIICLTPDVRIGPLAPGACFVTELKFVALTASAPRLEALRVVDLATGDAFEIKELPDIVVALEDSNHA